MMVVAYSCRMNTNFWACCFKPPERAPDGKHIVSGFQLDKETEADICSGMSPEVFSSETSVVKHLHMGAYVQSIEKDGGEMRLGMSSTPSE